MPRGCERARRADRGAEPLSRGAAGSWDPGRPRWCAARRRSSESRSQTSQGWGDPGAVRVRARPARAPLRALDCWGRTIRGPRSPGTRLCAGSRLARPAGKEVFRGPGRGGAGSGGLRYVGGGWEPAGSGVAWGKGPEPGQRAALQSKGSRAQGLARLGRGEMEKQGSWGPGKGMVRSLIPPTRRYSRRRRWAATFLEKGNGTRDSGERRTGGSLLGP